MEAQPLEVRVYRTSEGRAPFKEWLKELPDREARARINVRLTRARSGNLGDVKAVGEGVSELRIDYGAGYRLYFAQAGELLVLLLCAGDKRTQSRDIKQAQDFWQDYQQRLDGDRT